MQQAYAQANEVVQIATKQAQEILDNATNEANNLRMSAMAYTDSQLKNIEDILTNSIDTTKSRYDGLISSLQGYLDIVSSNRTQLFPEEPDTEEEKIESKNEKNSVNESEDGIEVTSFSVSNDSEEE